MPTCPQCEKQAQKPSRSKPHEKLRKIAENRVFGSGRNAFAEQDYQCDQCEAKFTHSTDRNDFGWTLWRN